jgi:tRNA A37 threonylcarbamoyladenosine dehydratase
MPIHVSWGNPQKTYTLFRFEGKWTWEEYHEAVAQGFELVKDCDYTVNILIDMMDCRLFPQNLLSHFGTSMRQPPKAFDIAVIATASRFIEVLASTIEKMYGKQQTRFRVARSVEKAHQILADHDAASVNSA